MITTNSERETARETAERRRDRGLGRAVHDHTRDIAEMQLRFLDLIATSPAGTATTDDAAGKHLHRRYTDGGKWVGSAVRELSTEGLIRPDGFVLSDRASRHRSPIRVWAAADHGAIDRRRQHLRRMIESWPAESPTANETGATAATVTPANSDSLTTKELSNEPTT